MRGRTAVCSSQRCPGTQGGQSRWRGGWPRREERAVTLKGRVEPHRMVALPGGPCGGRRGAGGPGGGPEREAVRDRRPALWFAGGLCESERTWQCWRLAHRLVTQPWAQALMTNGHCDGAVSEPLSQAWGVGKGRAGLHRGCLRYREQVRTSPEEPGEASSSDPGGGKGACLWSWSL